MGVSLRMLGRGGVGGPPAGSPWTWVLIALNEESLHSVEWEGPDTRQAPLVLPVHITRL